MQIHSNTTAQHALLGRPPHYRCVLRPFVLCTACITICITTCITTVTLASKLERVSKPIVRGVLSSLTAPAPKPSKVRLGGTLWL